MARIRTTEISGTECIGDSLIRINQNFEVLDTLTENLTSYAAGLSAFIDESTPTPPILSLVAGNGILIDGGSESTPENQNVSVAAYDSIIHIPNNLTTLIAQANSITYPLADGTTPRFTRLPYVTTEIKPGISFETTSLGTVCPSLTLYWLTSSGTLNATAYASNSGVAWPSWYPNNNNAYASDTAVVRCAKLINERTLLIGGTFTKMGSALAANAPSRGTLRNRFAVIDLQGGPMAPNGSGPVGALSSIPMTTGTVGERLLNTSNGTAPGNLSTNGITTGAVYAIEHFRVPSNNSEWYALGGTFTTASPIADASVDGLVLIHKNNTTTACKEYPLIVTGSVVRLLYADGYLYVAGGATQVRATHANWGANVVNANIPVPGLFRIDMTGTTPRIDTDFISQLLTTGETFGGPVLCMNYYDGILYVGGRALVAGPTIVVTSKNKPRSSRCFAAIYTQPTGTGRTPADRAPGRVVKDWGINIANYNGTYYIGIRSIAIDPIEKMLYVAGDPLSFTERVPYTQVNGTLRTARGIMAFDITNPAKPVYKQNWVPTFLPLNYQNSVVSIALHEPGNQNSPLYAFASKNLFYCISNPNAGGNPNATAGLLGSWKQSINTNVPYTEFYPDTLIRIPSTNSLSGVLVTGDFTTVNAQTRSNVARVNGIFEGISTPISSVAFNIQGSLVSVGEPLDQSTSLITLTADIGSPFELRRTVTPPLTAVFGNTIARKQLLRFTISRPGDDGVEIDENGNELLRPDTHKSDIWLYGLALDFNE